MGISSLQVMMSRIETSKKRTGVHDRGKSMSVCTRLQHW